MVCKSVFQGDSKKFSSAYRSIPYRGFRHNKLFDRGKLTLQSIRQLWWWGCNDMSLQKTPTSLPEKPSDSP